MKNMDSSRIFKYMLSFRRQAVTTECLVRCLLLSEYLDVDAVNEDDRIVCIQAVMEPRVHLIADVVDHPGYA